jgi:pyruvate/2-oxoacid:ferredoxin oxidoreductase beta subunit
MLKIELLEDRLVPAVIPIMGTDGDDSWVVSGKGRNVTVTQTLANGIPASIVTQFSNVDRLELDLKGGNDTFVTTANVPITGSLGAGNDQLRSDGAEGQSVMVDGGDGDDLLVGGRSLD